METGTKLRQLVHRKFTFEGKFDIDEKPKYVTLPGFVALADDGKQRKVATAGDTLTLVSTTAFTTHERVTHIRPHPDLYKLGTVICVPFVTPDDGMVQLTVQFTAHKRTDLTKFPYLIELYVGV